MKIVLQPCHLLVLILASWLNRQQLAVVNLTDPSDGFLRAKGYLLMDRDTKYSQAFRALLEQAGVNCVRLPARSPNLTPHIERFMRTIKEECLGRMIFFGRNSLQNAVHEFLLHYHRERNHQGLENRLIDPGDAAGELQGRIEWLRLNSFFSISSKLTMREYLGTSSFLLNTSTIL